MIRACRRVLTSLLFCACFSSPSVLLQQPSGSPLDLDLAEAEGFLAIGNTSRARALGRIAFSRDPGDARPLLLLARAALHEKKEEEADLYLWCACERGFVPAPGSLEEARVARLAGEGAAGGTGAQGVRIVARGLSYAEGTGPSARPTVDVGGSFDARSILFMGLDAAGHRVALDVQFSSSEGLRLQREGGKGATRILAGETASPDEWIDLVDGKHGARMRLPVFVAGPVESVRVGTSSFIGGNRAYAAPGAILPVRALLQDARFTRLYRPRLEWRASRRSQDVSSLLDDTTSRRPPSHFFEPHRVLLTVPEARAEITVTARDPATGIEGHLVVVVDPAAAPERLPIPLDLFEGSFDEAVSRARRDARPVLIVAAAFW